MKPNVGPMVGSKKKSKQIKEKKTMIQPCLSSKTTDHVQSH